MSRQKYTTAQKLALAQAIFDQNTNSSKLPPDMAKMADDISQMNEINSGLADFAIPLSEISEHYYKLMQNMAWIDWDTGEPLLSPQSRIFIYSHKISERAGITEISHYIEIDSYVALLFIEQELKDQLAAA